MDQPLASSLTNGASVPATTGDQTPWQVVLTGTRGTYYIPQLATQEAIAAATDRMDGFSVSNPAARLIEAAPWMLAALKSAQQVLEYTARAHPEITGTIALHSALHEVEAAIKAAQS